MALRLSEKITDLVILLLLIQAMHPVIALISAVYIDSYLGSLPNNMLLGLFELFNSTLLVSGSLDPFV